jgi:radical SAM superfamily enzyme YgiQ (UPF0313 family)
MSRFRILLIYPEIPETYWSMKRAIRIVGRKALLPPLGLLTIAAYFPEDAFELRLVDLNTRPLRDADLRWANLAMLSSMLVQKDSFHAVIRRCQAKGLPVAAGGPYPTACRAEMTGIDILVAGEAELTMPALVADLRAGHPTAVYEERGKPELDTSPVPRFDLARMQDYQSMPVQFSRGCPFACEFCDITAMFGRRVRTKSPARFIQELDALLAAGAPENVFVVDDNFIGNHRQARSLLQAMAVWQQQHGRPFTMSTEASIDLASDEELMDLMVAANFAMVFIGLESPHAASLAATGKEQNLKVDAEAAVATIQRKGLQVSGGFIVGFDSDPPDICELQASFVKRLAVPVAMVGLLTALPGTELSRRLEREGRLLAESSGNNTHDTSFNFRTILPTASLIDGYHWLMAELYRPRAYFDRCLTYLRRLHDGGRRQQRGRGTLTPSNISALFRSILLQGCSRYGLEYLRYLAKAIKIGPQLLHETITLAVQGRHFFAITNQMLARHQLRLHGQSSGISGLRSDQSATG